MNSQLSKKIHFTIFTIISIYYLTLLILPIFGYSSKQNTTVELMLEPIWIWFISYFTSKNKNIPSMVIETFTWICFMTCLIIFGEEDWEFFQFKNEIMLLFVMNFAAIIFIVLNKMKDWGEL
jgi:hypothetical protein